MIVANNSVPGVNPQVPNQPQLLMNDIQINLHPMSPIKQVWSLLVPFLL
jgi:hypothetical protein